MLIIGLIAGLILATAASSMAAPTSLKKITATLRPDYTIKVDGHKAALKNTPISYNDTTYVPLRDLGELLGREVGFDSKTSTITLDQKAKDASDVSTTTAVTEAPDVNMDEWIGLYDLFQTAVIKWEVGIPVGESPTSENRVYRLKSGDKIESFIIPRSIAGDLLVTNENGNQLLFRNGEKYIKKTFSEQFISQ